MINLFVCIPKNRPIDLNQLPSPAAIANSVTSGFNLPKYRWLIDENYEIVKLFGNLSRSQQKKLIKRWFARADAPHTKLVKLYKSAEIPWSPTKPMIQYDLSKVDILRIKMHLPPIFNSLNTLKRLYNSNELERGLLSPSNGMELPNIFTSTGGRPYRILFSFDKDSSEATNLVRSWLKSL